MSRKVADAIVESLESAGIRHEEAGAFAIGAEPAFLQCNERKAVWEIFI
jgi:hypothetical protein